MKRLDSVTESYVGQEERERTRRKRLGPQIHKLLGHTLETERARGRSVILTEEIVQYSRSCECIGGEEWSS